MLISLIIAMLTGLFNFLFSWLPAVTSLPTIAGADMDLAVGTMFNYMHSFLELMPFLGIVWSCLLWYYGIKLFLLSWGFIRWAINLIRGAGS